MLHQAHVEEVIRYLTAVPGQMPSSEIHPNILEAKKMVVLLIQRRLSTLQIKLMSRRYWIDLRPNKNGHMLLKMKEVQKLHLPKHLKTWVIMLMKFFILQIKSIMMWIKVLMKAVIRGKTENELAKVIPATETAVEGVTHTSEDDKRK